MVKLEALGGVDGREVHGALPVGGAAGAERVYGVHVRDQRDLVEGRYGEIWREGAR